MKHYLKSLTPLLFVLSGFFWIQGCKPKGTQSAVSGNAASKVYVAPGKYDEFYNFISGSFSGQMSVYGLPSGRLFRVIPVFSVDPEKGCGYSEETKPMLNTSHGFVPWDDLHHIALSVTGSEHDGRGAFGNANNTPRIARIDLKHSVQRRKSRYPIVQVTTPLLLLRIFQGMRGSLRRGLCAIATY